MWPHSEIGENITHDKTSSCVRERGDVPAFLVHLGVNMSNWWTHHTCFLAFAAALDFPGKEEKSMYSYCIYWI